MSAAAPHNQKRIVGSATAQGTLRYAARFQGQSAAGHFREIPGGLVLSSIGIGTYLGEPDDATDKAYTDAIVAAVEGGVNVIDSAINYRFQRSERAAGAALKVLAAKGFSRDEILLCTKAGFLTPDGEMPPDPNVYFAHEFLDRGVFVPEEIAAGCHCMSPKYLADQLERSLANFGVESIDVFYLHNPETQLTEVSAPEFQKGSAPRSRTLSLRLPAEKSARMGWPRGMRFARTRNLQGICRSKGWLRSRTKWAAWNITSGSCSCHLISRCRKR